MAALRGKRQAAHKFDVLICLEPQTEWDVKLPDDFWQKYVDISFATLAGCRVVETDWT